MRRDLVIVLDPAHGEETPGKRSPDGKFREYAWSREIISLLVDKLDDLGFQIQSSNASRKEIGLSNRAEIANRFPGKRKVFISIHSNAAGNGLEWANARGFSVYTTKGNTKSDKVAEQIMSSLIAEFPEIKARKEMSDGDMDTEENFTVIYKTNFPSVLIEWLFQDNKDDVKLLLDEEHNNRFVNAIVDAIVKIDENKII